MNDTSLENCIKCTVCTTACPVNRANPGHPGPKQAEPGGKRLRLKDGALYGKALKYCINCKRCEVACPSDMKIGDIIQRARAKYDAIRSLLHNFVLSHTDLIDSISTPFAPIVSTAVSLKPVRQLFDVTLKIDHRRTLPECSFDTFHRWYHSVAARQAQYKSQATFFHGYFVNYSHPQLDKDLIKVLNAMGTDAQLLSRERCYGIPLIADGFTNEARKQAITNTESIRKAVGVKNIPVIATSSMCTFVLHDGYPEVPNVDNKGLRDHIELTTRWLWHKLDEGRTLPLKPLPLKVVYHTPCHMEKMSWTFYTLELLRKIPGLELAILGSQYCGIAGTYSFKKENYPTSQAIGVPLFHQIKKSDVDLVVIDYGTCK